MERRVGVKMAISATPPTAVTLFFQNDLTHNISQIISHKNYLLGKKMFNTAITQVSQQLNFKRSCRNLVANLAMVNTPPTYGTV